MHFDLAGGQQPDGIQTGCLCQNGLVLCIVDDGVGFDPSVDPQGNGLTSMRTRAARMHGDLQIVPGAPSGTSITLSVPV